MPLDTMDAGFTKLKTAIVMNENAGSLKAGKAGAQDLLAFCQERYPDILIWKSSELASQAEWAKRVEAENIELLIAAGGDGTIHYFVNALRDQLSRLRFGIIPLGTGNDFSRSFGIPLDPVEALQQALGGHEERMDLIHVRAADDSGSGQAGKDTLCVNHISAGLGGEIQARTESAQKLKWKALAYARTALQVAAEKIPEYRLQMTIDGQELGPVQATNLVIGNGRTAGGGFELAPHADPGDAWMDIVIVKSLSTLQAAEVSARLLAGDYTKSDSVEEYRARTLRISCDPELLFSVDGDQFCSGGADFRLVSGILRMTLPTQAGQRAA